MSQNRVRLITTVAVISFAVSPNPASAQLLVIEDLFNQLTLLDVELTLNGQAITNNTNSIVAIEADVTVLEGQVVQIQADLDANNALDIVQSGQIAAIDSRVTTVETQTGINTGAIATLDVRLDANDALDAVQTTQIAAIDGRVTVVETQTGINTGAITGIGARLDINDLRDVAQDVILNDHEQRLDGHDVQLASLDGRLTANDTRDNGQDARLNGHDTELASLDQRLTVNDGRDDGQDVELASLGQRLTVNDARDDTQALLLVEHDLRIGNAQVTANTALSNTADLRSAIVAGQIGLVQQASYSAPITVGSATGGDYVSFAGQAGDRRLGGVAAGVNANDAVNLSQLQLAGAAVLDQARAYTDTSIANLGFDLSRLTQIVQYNARELRQEIQAAGAGAAALAGLPQSFQPGKGLVAVGLGGRGSNTAFALGVGKAFIGPNTPVVRAGVAIDARRGDVTYNAAVGFHF